MLIFLTTNNPQKSFLSYLTLVIGMQLGVSQNGSQFKFQTKSHWKITIIHAHLNLFLIQKILLYTQISLLFENYYYTPLSPLNLSISRILESKVIKP